MLISSKRHQYVEPIQRDVSLQASSIGEPLESSTLETLIAE